MFKSNQWVLMMFTTNPLIEWVTLPWGKQRLIMTKS